MKALLLLALALPASAQVDPSGFRLLPPAASAKRDVSVTASYASRYPDTFKPGTPSYGVGGGVEVEVPVTRRGTSVIAGISGIDHYRTYPAGGAFKQDRVRSLPLTLGVLQKLGRAGWGDALGERGVFVEPHVGAGVGVAGVTTFVGPTAEPQPYANGVIETRAPVLPMPWVSAGARLTASKGLALGLEARRYRVLQPNEVSPHGGTYLFLTLTAEPRLTRRLKRRN